MARDVPAGANRPPRVRDARAGGLSAAARGPGDRCRQPGARARRRSDRRTRRPRDPGGVRAVREVLVRRVPGPDDARAGVQRARRDDRRREHRPRPRGRQGMRLRAAAHGQLGCGGPLVRRQRLPDRGRRRGAQAAPPVRTVPAPPRGARHADRGAHQGRTRRPAAQAAPVRELDGGARRRPRPHGAGDRGRDVRRPPAGAGRTGAPVAQLRCAAGRLPRLHARRRVGGPDRGATRDRTHRRDPGGRRRALAADGRTLRAGDRRQAHGLAHVPAGMGRVGLGARRAATPVEPR